MIRILNILGGAYAAFLLSLVALILAQSFLPKAPTPADISTYQVVCTTTTVDASTTVTCGVIRP